MLARSVTWLRTEALPKLQRDFVTSPAGRRNPSEAERAAARNPQMVALGAVKGAV